MSKYYPNKPIIILRFIDSLVLSAEQDFRINFAIVQHSLDDSAHAFLVLTGGRTPSENCPDFCTRLCRASETPYTKKGSRGKQTQAAEDSEDRCRRLGILIALRKMYRNVLRAEGLLAQPSPLYVSDEHQAGQVFVRLDCLAICMRKTVGITLSVVCLALGNEGDSCQPGHLDSAKVLR